MWSGTIEAEAQLATSSIENCNHHFLFFFVITGMPFNYKDAPKQNSGVYLWQGPLHERTSICSFSDRQLKYLHSKTCTMVPQWHERLISVLQGGHSPGWHRKGQGCGHLGSLSWNKITYKEEKPIRIVPDATKLKSFWQSRDIAIFKSKLQNWSHIYKVLAILVPCKSSFYDLRHETYPTYKK